MGPHAFQPPRGLRSVLAHPVHGHGRIATGFGDAIMDDEDEENFREAMGPKIKVIDAAAMRAGHLDLISA